MATLAEFRNLVSIALGRDDAEANTIITAAVNYAVVIASLTFEPPEMYSIDDVVLTGGSDRFVNITTSLDANLLDVIKVYNKTDDYKLDFIPYELWDKIIPILTTVKFWTLFGNILIVKNTPSSNLDLTISYSTYPAALVNETDEPSFTHLDPFIISNATSIAFAAFEEEDAVGLWAKIASLVGNPAALSTKAKTIIEGQRTLLENAMAQSRGEA